MVVRGPGVERGSLLRVRSIPQQIVDLSLEGNRTHDDVEDVAADGAAFEFGVLTYGGGFVRGTVDEECGTVSHARTISNDISGDKRGEAGREREVRRKLDASIDGQT